MKGALKRTGVLAVCTALLVMAGCGRNEKTSIEDMTAPEIFSQAEAELETGNSGDAAVTFGEVERLYPYSELAKRALIMQAYSYHLGKDYENSRSAAQRYIEFYPAGEDAAYAQYLLALSHYDQIDEIGRDQSITLEALQALRTVIERYPESGYSRSSSLKFDLAFNHLAAKEMEVGRYYHKRGHYAAAANRFRIVVEQFQTTTHTAEALYRLIEAYLSLGLENEAQTAGAILGYNYQSTQWYSDGYSLLTGRGLRLEVADEGWLRNVYRQMVRGEWL